MVPTVMALNSYIADAGDPTSPRFWFVMSSGLLVGFIIAYPVNWWLVANHLKHGMMTVRPVSGEMSDRGGHANMPGMADPTPPMQMSRGGPLRPPLSAMALLSFAALSVCVAISLLFRPS